MISIPFRQDGYAFKLGGSERQAQVLFAVSLDGATYPIDVGRYRHS